MPPGKSWDDVAPIYDATRGLPAEISERVAGVLADVFGRDSHVLEVGIGTGRMAVPLARCGVRVTGIDVSRPMLAVLREKTPRVEAARARANALPFGAAVFDGALLVHVLHLVPDVAEVVRSAAGVLRRGGRVAAGGDDPGRGPWQEGARCVRRVVKEVTGRELPSWDRHTRAGEQAEATLASLGARCRRVELARWQETLTARQFVRNFEHRICSASWAIPEDEIPRVVARAVPALEGIYGDLDRPIPSPRRMSALVAELPHASAARSQ